MFCSVLKDRPLLLLRILVQDKQAPINTWLPVSTARKQEIIKITEQLIEALNNGDFEAYA